MVFRLEQNFIKEINGCYYNVIGLPIPKLFKIFGDKIQLNNFIKKTMNIKKYFKD